MTLLYGNRLTLPKKQLHESAVFSGGVAAAKDVILLLPMCGSVSSSLSFCNQARLATVSGTQQQQQQQYQGLLRKSSSSLDARFPPLHSLSDEEHGFFLCSQGSRHQNQASRRQAISSSEAATVHSARYSKALGAAMCTAEVCVVEGYQFM
jgi:hypothetical protein